MIKHGSVYNRKSEQLHKLVGRKVTIIDTATKKVVLENRLLTHTSFKATSGTRDHPGYYVNGQHLQIRGTETVDPKTGRIVYNFAYNSATQNTVAQVSQNQQGRAA